MVRTILLSVLLWCALSLTANAQETKALNLQQTIMRSIKRAYPASVRIWAFDIVRNVRTGPQFTGVVVTPEGHILTAAHVNTPKATYKVMFPDGRTTIALGRGEIELEGKTFMPDVAMLKIVNKGVWPFAPMGHSAKLAKGMLSISIAYPESLDQPLPMIRVGEIYDVHNAYGFLQSTCLMEPGDSGGPLFNSAGEVIGIHSAVDVSEKENFEVPVDLYRTYWTALQESRTYGEYPAQKDSIARVDVSGMLQVFPELDDPDHFIEVKKTIMSSNVHINSIVLGKSQQILGAMIDVKRLKARSSRAGVTFVISKSSYVGENPVAVISGRTYDAKVIKRDRLNDLVLLAINKNLKGGIKLLDVDAGLLTFDNLGRVLASPLGSNRYRISVLGTTLFKLPKLESIGHLGVQVAYFGPLLITEIPSGTFTEKVFEKGDELMALNGELLNSRADFLRLSKNYWPGDTISVSIKRSGRIMPKAVILGWKPENAGNHQAELFEGGKSRRRDGFEFLFAHDARLKPEECGGAVFDPNGEFYGINIGRSSRVSNLVIPASVVIQFVENTLRR